MNKEEHISLVQAWKWNMRAWRVWWKLCPGVFISDFLCSVFKALTPYTAIYLSAQLLNELAGRRDSRMLLLWVAAALACEAVLALINGGLIRWSGYEKDTARRMDDRIYIEKMLSLDYADIDRQYVFDLYSQIMQNENWNGWGIHKTLYYFGTMITYSVQILGGIIFSIRLFTARVPQSSSLALMNSPLWALVLLLFVIALSALTTYIGRRIMGYWADYADNVRLGNRYTTFFCGMSEERKRAADIRIYNQQENVCIPNMAKENFFGPGSEIARAFLGTLGWRLFFAGGTSSACAGAVYLFVCVKAWCGAFGIGSAAQYIGSATQLFLGIANLMGMSGSFCANGSFLKTAFEFLDIPNKMYQGSLTTEKRSDRQYCVEFRDVSFKYPGADGWALRHVNMTFKVGSRLAVVGVNGSGKTTFIKLLCRLYDPTEGTILLNGIDIRKYRYDDYIQLFSVVFQDFKLLARPIKENVAVTADGDSRRVEACLRAAGFDSRAKAMTKGIDTPLYKDLDENGVEVSGGEAQKLAIARALYKDAPFIILDEPTAALDPMAEAEIYARFDDIVGDKTAVYISHRLSSCKFCDEIAVFDAGLIVQQGNHHTLVADRDGCYARLWSAQADYYRG